MEIKLLYRNPASLVVPLNPPTLWTEGELFEEPWSCLVERVVSSLSLSHFQFPTSSVEWISFTFLLATEFYCLLTVGDADNKVGEGNPSDLLRLSRRQGSQ